MPSTTVGTGSFLAGVSTLLYSWTRKLPEPVKVAVVPEDTVFVHWPSEEHGEETDTLDPECAWWNGSVTYTTTTCSHFHVSRIAPAHSKRALYRALRCAVAENTECVLAAEIGFALPAAFLYGGAGELRMVVAPRLSDTADNSTSTVRVAPIEGGTTQTLELKKEIQAEFIGESSRVPRSEVFSGQEAYCLQLLRHTYDTACWEALD